MRWFKPRIDHAAVFAADDRLQEAARRMKNADEEWKVKWRNYFSAVNVGMNGLSQNERARFINNLPFPDEQ